MKNLSKTEVEKQIQEFFKDIKTKTPKEIKKIKKLAMRHNIKLGNKKKLFCKKCFKVYDPKDKVRIKNKTKSITCSSCGIIIRRKL